jgi:methylated-DNA-[protein]-cysteine S-methyltransferase
LIFTTSFQSPIGQVKIEADENHITEIIFTNQLVKDNPNQLTALASAQLQAYFTGRRRVFDLPLADQGTDFQNRVLDLVAEVPFGKTISYKKLAGLYGDQKAIRAVAAANRKNKFAIVVPCHRVIGRDGSLTGYAWGLDKKEWLLQHEGAIQPKFF